MGSMYARKELDDRTSAKPALLDRLKIAQYEILIVSTFFFALVCAVSPGGVHAQQPCDEQLNNCRTQLEHLRGRFLERTILPLNCESPTTVRQKASGGREAFLYTILTILGRRKLAI